MIPGSIALLMKGQGHLAVVIAAGGEAGVDCRDQVIEQRDHRAVARWRRREIVG